MNKFKVGDEVVKVRELGDRWGAMGSRGIIHAISHKSISVDLNTRYPISFMINDTRRTNKTISLILNPAEYELVGGIKPKNFVVFSNGDYKSYKHLRGAELFAKRVKSDAVIYQIHSSYIKKEIT